MVFNKLRINGMIHWQRINSDAGGSLPETRGMHFCRVALAFHRDDQPSVRASKDALVLNPDRSIFDSDQ